MAKKTSKKASSKKAASKKAKTGSVKKTSVKKAEAKKTEVKKAKTKKSAKKAEAPKKKIRKTKSAGKSTLTILSTGAGAKLNGKMGSAGSATKKASVRKNRRKASPLTGQKLAEFRELLIQRRRELLDSVYQMRAEALDKNRQDAAGHLSKFPTSPADLGSDNYELEFTLTLMEGEQDILREISEALTRIDQGVYGICEGTGEAIPRTRLKYEPWTRYTVEYASLVEKGLVRPDEEDETDNVE